MGSESVGLIASALLSRLVVLARGVDPGGDQLR
jgi:hypothetical protein